MLQAVAHYALAGTAAIQNFTNPIIVYAGITATVATVSALAFQKMGCPAGQKCCAGVGLLAGAVSTGVITLLVIPPICAFAYLIKVNLDLLQ